MSCLHDDEAKCTLLAALQLTCCLYSLRLPDRSSSGFVTAVLTASSATSLVPRLKLPPLLSRLS